ncbi:MAG: tetratricopeptide repeat protein, partial [Bacteroidota bacterium]
LQNENYHASLNYLQTIPMDGQRGLANVPHIMARAYQGLENYAQALAHLDMAVQLDGKNANLYYARGRLHHRLRQPDIALQDFDEALLLNPQHIQAQHERGLVMAGEQPESYFYNIENEWDMEDSLMAADFEENETNDDAGEWDYESYELVQTQEAAETDVFPVTEEAPVERAAASFGPTPAPTSAPDNPRSAGDKDLSSQLMKEARQYEREGMEAQAIAVYGEVISAFPKMSKAYFRRGKILEQLGRYEEALADYDMALQFNQNNTVVLLTRANLLVNTQQVYRAIDDYAQILRLDPNQQTARFQRGQLYTKVRQLDAALTDFNQVIAERPEWSEPLYHRAQLLVAMGKNADARKDIDGALRLEPSNRRYRQLANTLSGT